MLSDSCSLACADHPQLGTATQANSFVVFDQARPWPKKIALPEPLSLPLAGPGPTLARQPQGGTPLLQLFRWEGEELWHCQASLEKPADFTPWRVWTQPCLLVCTHGSRDRCCGSQGVKLARLLRDTLPGEVEIWEVSHLGGHRFAPTLWALPWGRFFGRLPLEGPRLRHWWSQLLGCDPGLLTWLRGNCRYSPRLQVLEAELFRSRGQWPVQLSEVDDGYDVVWRDQSQSHFRVNWKEQVLRGPFSCGDGPERFQSTLAFQIQGMSEVRSEGVGFSMRKELQMSNAEVTMTDDDLTLLRTLVALAWADGSLAPGEMEWIDRVMDQLQVAPEMRAELLKAPAGLPEAPSLQQALPEEDDRETFLRFLLSVSLEDGETSLDELKMLQDLSAKLGVSPEALERMRKNVCAT